MAQALSSNFGREQLLDPRLAELCTVGASAARAVLGARDAPRPAALRRRRVGARADQPEPRRAAHCACTSGTARKRWSATRSSGGCCGSAKRSTAKPRSRRSSPIEPVWRSSKPRLGAGRMGELSSTEHEAVERAAAEPMLDQVLAWAAVNSGSRNLAGLGDDGGAARRRVRRPARRASCSDPAPVEAVDAAGQDDPARARPQPAPHGPARRAGAAALHRPHGHGVRRRSPVPGRRAGSRTACSTGPASPT